MTTFEHKGVTYRLPKGIGANNNVINAIKFYLDNGKVPSLKEMKSVEYERNYGKYDSNWNDRMGKNSVLGFFGYESDRSEEINSGKGINNPEVAHTWGAISRIKDYLESEEGKKHIQEDNPNIEFDEETRNPVFDKETGRAQLTEEAKANSSASEFNPYTQWLETQRQQTESAELGLLNTQTDGARQNAEITAQQSMMQQAQLKDQLVEQIKLDRMAKMRSGISPMQIANEGLQFLVGNMQANNQQVGAVNQARLAATQQGEMNPYQAYLNSVNGAGYQSQANVATGMAATDASDMYQQALKYAKSQGRNYIDPNDYKIVQGLYD